MLENIRKQSPVVSHVYSCNFPNTSNFDMIVADFRVWSGVCMCGSRSQNNLQELLQEQVSGFCTAMLPSVYSGFWEIIYILLWTPFPKRLHEKNLPLVTPARCPSVWCFVFPDVFGFCLNVLVNTFQGLNSISS